MSPVVSLIVWMLLHEHLKAFSAIVIVNMYIVLTIKYIYLQDLPDLYRAVSVYIIYYQSSVHPMNIEHT